MNKIKEFIQSIPFLLSFLLLVLMIQLIAGGKFLSYFLWLVFLSMLVLNGDKLSNTMDLFNEKRGK